MSRELPLLLNTPMVQAVLAGRKTQTRRPVKWPAWANPNMGPMLVGALKKGQSGLALYKDGRAGKFLSSPFGQPGDLLYVRETWMELDSEIFYRAGDPGWDDNCDVTWGPSIHMPKKYARIWLKVLRAWVGRVQDISEADAKAEGVEESEEGHHGQWCYVDPFARLWDSIHAAKGFGWDANPWVWCCEFESN